MNNVSNRVNPQQENQAQPMEIVQGNSAHTMINLETLDSLPVYEGPPSNRDTNTDAELNHPRDQTVTVEGAEMNTPPEYAPPEYAPQTDQEPASNISITIPASSELESPSAPQL
ncbi:hypothetical protein BGX26_001874 [Mortierella sp. AD094]|nr:hypothetical protein BGX26_001874 [Mortierella sp. AD094]